MWLFWYSHIHTDIKGRDTRCDISLRHVAATGCCNKSPLVTYENHCRCDLSHEFKLVWIRATYRSDKISASSLVESCVRICDKSLQQNWNQPMRKHKLVCRHIYIWTSLHFLSSNIDYVHQTSVLSQRLVAGSVQTRGLCAAMCRSDLSHRVFRP